VRVDDLTAASREADVRIWVWRWPREGPARSCALRVWPRSQLRDAGGTSDEEWTPATTLQVYFHDDGTVSAALEQARWSTGLLTLLVIMGVGVIFWVTNPIHPDILARLIPLGLIAAPPVMWALEIRARLRDTRILHAVWDAALASAASDSAR